MDNIDIEDLKKQGWLPPNEIVNAVIESIRAAFAHQHLVISNQEALEVASTVMLAEPHIQCGECGHGPYLHDPEHHCIALTATIEPTLGLYVPCGCSEYQKQQKDAD